MLMPPPLTVDLIGLDVGVRVRVFVVINFFVSRERGWC